MSKDPLELPSRPKVTLLGKERKTSGGALQPHHVEALVGTASTLVQGFAEVRRIKAEAKADVARIDAETRRFEAEASAAIRRYIEGRNTMRARGDVAVKVIAAITDSVNGLADDPDARMALIAMLPRLVEVAVREAGPDVES